MRTEPVTMFLCGDVMLGRGVDQILPHPGDPALEEYYVRDARGYVELAERANGPIPRPVDFAWPWGEALDVLADASPDARVLNLETSVTRDGEFAPGKGIHYRMHPDNLPCLAAVRPDVCSLANNHVMDFGPRGLEDTLDSLAAAGLRFAGAGRGAAAARAPAAVDLDGGGRILVTAFGTASTGIPPAWAAREDRPGVHLVPENAELAVPGIAERVRRERGPRDVVVASVHWGTNWGYDVTEQTDLAHALVDGGVDVVHGHSSHHPRPIEVYRDRLVLYGCGDFVNDYEGIQGYERYRDDLRLMYLVSVAPGSGRLLSLRMVPLRSRRMRLEPASPQDARWLQETLDDVSRDLGSRVVPEADGLALRWT
ncbi:CapA family protein [Nocardiopsis sp. FIRDI 009]|uniref:CapA family protein n=1 Tax=Nocardiopsis sp. FIRDI 009 TaxID=714197 RepID=UPI000E2614D1|nr:CapA family protein [Nocardiopsis sp. FIRDI 009]